MKNKKFLGQILAVMLSLGMAVGAGAADFGDGSYVGLFTDGADATVTPGAVPEPSEIPEIENEYEYSVQEDMSICITAYKGASGDVKIPQEIDGKKVTGIGASAFKDHTELASVQIPDGVIQIGAAAFSGCTSLKEVRIEDADCVIEEAQAGMGDTIPKSVKIYGQPESQAESYARKNGNIFESLAATPTETVTPTPEVSEVPKPTEEVTPMPEVSEAPKPTEEVTPTPEVSEAPIPTGIVTPTPEVSEAPAPTGTVTPMPEVSEAPKPTEEVTPTPEVSEAPMPTGAVTPTPEVSEAPTPTGTVTPTPEVSEAPTPTGTVTPTPEVSEAPTPTETVTPAPEVTATPTPTPVPVKISKTTIKLSKTTLNYTGKALVPSVTVQYNKTTLKPGVDYTVSYANNKNIGTATVTVKGKGSYTGTKKATFKIVLGAPAMKSAVSAGYNAVKVTWNKVPGAKSYTLYYKGGNVKKWKAAATKLTKTYYTHKSGLTTGTQYTYTVKAVRDKSVSTYGKSTKAAKPVPAQVKLGKVTSAAYNKQKITWSKVAGATGYVVYQKINGKWKSIGSTKELSFINKNSKDHPVKTGVTNTYTVRAYRKVSGKNIYGSYSKTGISGKALLAKPAISKITKTSKGLKLQWKKVTGATGYVVQRYESGKWVIKKTINSSKTLTYTDTTAKKGKTYKYRIQAFCKVNGKPFYSVYSATKSGKR